MRKFLPLALLVIIVCSWETVAQTACTQTLRQARTVYDEGRIQELPSLLSSCLKNGFTDEEKTEAYRLLVLAYIYLDEPQKADESMLALLRHNPQFQINTTADPAELISLYGTFRTNPIFSYGFKGGGNLSFVEVLKNYTVLPPEGSNGDYELNPGYQIAVFVERILNQRITVSGELYFVGNVNTYGNEFEGVDSLYKFVESQEFRLSQTSIALPVTIQYKPILGSKYNPYIFGGFGINYLVRSSFNGETNTSSEGFEGATVDLMEQRKTINFNGIAGFGIKMKVGKNTFIAEARFNYGILNQVEGSERYSNQELIYDYGYVDDDFKLHSVAVSLGYMFPFYKPKKLTKR